MSTPPAGAGYIKIPNWKKFQHYHDRNPTWIKLYTRELMRKDEYRALSLAQRGLLQDLWKLIAEFGDGQLSANPKTLARELHVPRVNLEPLIQAGWIKVCASRSVPKRSKSAPPELRGEKEDRPPYPLKRGSRSNGTNPRALVAAEKKQRAQDKELERAVDLYMQWQDEDGELNARRQVHECFPNVAKRAIELAKDGAA